MSFSLQDSDEDDDDDQDGTEEETEVIIPNLPSQMMVPQLSNNKNSNNNISKQQKEPQSTTADLAKVTAPPALRITRKLTRPERQLKLEQHLDEQLERINENKSDHRTDKETNTECVFMHPNQSTIMRMRGQQQNLQQNSSKTDPNYLTVKRSQTFNTTVGPEGQEESSDYVCRVRISLIIIRN